MATSASCTRIALDCGDSYEGAVEVKNGVCLPHGHGVWHSADNTLHFEGNFVQRWRDGYGQLRTPAFTLWARWRMDRPDLSSAVRVDFCNGDRYCGFIEWKVRAPPASSSKAPRSKFSTWAASVVPVRQRWGELVTASGDTYVGEWRHDEREGFGCYVWPSGSRYTGRFARGQFSDVGTLFVAAAEVDGCFTQLSSGGWRCGAAGERPRDGQRVAGVPSCRAVWRWPPLSRPAWDGLIVDVVWADGRCKGEGHVTLPGGVRVSADWRTASSPLDAELVLPALSPQARVDPEAHEWHESFQWESLFSPPFASPSSGADGDKMASLRVRIQQSTSAEFVRSCVVELLTSHEVVRKALNVFRRCFYALYGTCGSEAAIGAGGSGVGLGWCSLRNPYGGCIHSPSPGRPITAGDLDLALRDIASVARSTVRWVLDLVGPEVHAKVLDCGGEAVIGRWVADDVLQHSFPVLRNLYSQVYRAGEAALAAAVARLRGAVSLDDMGVLFARQSESQARLFDPYTDAVHCVEQLNGEAQTLTRLLKVLVQWSREIDLSTRLTQASQEARGTGGAGRSTAKVAKTAAGSADDLLPIHQYVLSQSRCPHLYAVTKLLADFAGESLFMEATSQEAFGVTTLQVCVLALARLHPWERDGDGVTVPLTVTMDRVATVARRRSSHVTWTLSALCASPPPEEGDQVADVVRHYALLWLPRVVGWIGEHVSASRRSFAVAECGFSDDEVALLWLRPSVLGETVCCCCWLYASAVLGSLHLRLCLDSFVVPHQISSAEETLRACEALRDYVKSSSDETVLTLRVEVVPTARLIPTHMVQMESYLCELLSEEA